MIRASTTRSRLRGFTFVEMATTLVVLAVLIAVAAPSLAGFVRSSRVRAAQSELVSSLMLARSEASKRGVTVIVAAAASQPAGSEFSAGWVVCADLDASGTCNSGDTVIRSFPDVSAAVVLGTTGGVTQVAFAPTGFLWPPSAVNFKVCGKSDATKGFSVALQPVGLADLADQVSCP